MERRLPDVAGQVADLALADRENPARAVEKIREYAREMLDGAYPREALVEDFERARGVPGKGDRRPAKRGRGGCPGL